MFRFALSILQSSTAAEDAVQETFLQLCKCNKSFEDQRYLKNWLLKVAKNKSFDMARSPIGRAEVPFDHQSLSEMGMRREQSLPPGDTSDAGEVLERCVAQLSAKHRIVIHLFYVDGRSIKEIAEIFGVPQATGTGQLHRARKKIRKLLDEKPQEVNPHGIRLRPIPRTGANPADAPGKC